MATLKRTRDGAGDSGPMSSAGRYNPDTNEQEWIHNTGPVVGYVMQVGSHYARTYSAQDYWTTTYVTEILSDTIEDDSRVVRFKTGNSEYIWKE